MKMSTDDLEAGLLLSRVRTCFEPLSVRHRVLYTVYRYADHHPAVSLSLLVRYRYENSTGSLIMRIQSHPRGASEQEETVLDVDKTTSWGLSPQEVTVFDLRIIRAVAISPVAITGELQQSVLSVIKSPRC